MVDDCPESTQLHLDIHSPSCGGNLATGTCLVKSQKGSICPRRGWQLRLARCGRLEMVRNDEDLFRTKRDHRRSGAAQTLYSACAAYSLTGQSIRGSPYETARHTRFIMLLIETRSTLSLLEKSRDAANHFSTPREHRNLGFWSVARENDSVHKKQSCHFSARPFLTVSAPRQEQQMQSVRTSVEELRSVGKESFGDMSPTGVKTG